MQQQTAHIIVDPVMIAKGGAALLQDDAVHALNTKLLPLATVLTPNIPEAEVISGVKIRNEQDIFNAAKRILQLGVKCVVMKGGHFEEADTATDTVFLKTVHHFRWKRKELIRNIHMELDVRFHQQLQHF